MGLAIEVGALADLLENDDEGAAWLREGLAAANRCLEAAGLPAHEEPTAVELPATRASLLSMPYSFIHYLRRAYARRVDDPAWMAEPLDEDEDPADDPLLEEETEMLSSHLLCHSDAEGFYVPVDFADVLFDESEDGELPGGMLGSSYRLLEELVLVAPALGIRLDDGQLSDAEAQRVDDVACSSEGLCRELASWLALYEAARVSIAAKTAIVFG